MMVSQIFAIAALVYYSVFIQYSRKVEAAQKASLAAVSKCGALALVGSKFATEDELFEAALLRDQEFKATRVSPTLSFDGTLFRLSGHLIDGPKVNAKSSSNAPSKLSAEEDIEAAKKKGPNATTKLDPLDVEIISSVRKDFEQHAGQGGQLSRRQLKVEFTPS